MRKTRKGRKAFWHNIKFKYKLTIINENTLEEVVARNYLIDERPNAILNIVDGTNLERNLYLTTQLTELGIPVVVAINMMDVVRKNGDQINTQELSRALGCKVVEISALKGTGAMEAAEAAIAAGAGCIFAGMS
mgnify:FL=1